MTAVAKRALEIVHLPWYWKRSDIVRLEVDDY